ncbi:MAG: glycosidase [Bacillota bacterium]|nr:glycosidase [Bacillota bacterium]
MIRLERKGLVMGPSKGQLGEFARFNPGVILKDGVVHMLYRASDGDIHDKANYVSRIGYARLDVNGIVQSDSGIPVIYPTFPEEKMGCEDPRIVEFEGAFYVFYTAYDGKKARVAAAKTKDFKAYEKLGVIKHCFTFDKDAFIIPERVGGKIAFFHRIEPNIQLEYFDSMEELLSEKSWKGYENKFETRRLMKRKYQWEQKKIGGSLPPVKTVEGWLLIYHGVDNNNIYRVGAALLDLNNPSKVLCRLPYPILEPQEEYEISGDVGNVVFPCGAYVYNKELYIYYGGADKYIAMSKINVEELLKELGRYPC